MPFKIKFLFIVIFLSGCAAQNTIFPGNENITITNQTLIYDGVITGEAVLRAMRISRNNEKPITKLIITSPGGDLAAAIEFGYFIREHNLDVDVRKLCFSACANYILPAARKVVIKRESLVGWHGGAMQEDDLWRPSVPNEQRREFFKYLNKVRIREQAFYNSIGVDKQIATYGQTETESCSKQRYSEGWFYSIDDMNRMGIKDIIIEGGELVTKIEYEGEEIIACQMPPLFN